VTGAGLVIVAGNPYSGAAANRRRVDVLAGALAAAGLQSRLVWEPRERAALLGDPGLLRDCRAVVAAGGDGTVAQVVNELAASVPLGVLPLGNENLFARALGFSGDPAALAAAIVGGASRRLDLGSARASNAPAPGPRRFTLMVSVGFDADVVHRVARWRATGVTLRRVRRRSWVAPVARALHAYRHPPLALEVAGARVAGCHCVVANLPDYALGVRLAPDARGNDGRLDWVVLEPGGTGALARYGWAAWRGRHLARDDVRGGRAQRLRIDAVAPMPVQIDGEAWGVTPVDIDVLPGALAVVSSGPRSRRGQ
jgi:diacylglycerol kinase (ATP)